MKERWRESKRMHGPNDRKDSFPKRHEVEVRDLDGQQASALQTGVTVRKELTYLTNVLKGVSSVNGIELRVINCFERGPDVHAEFTHPIFPTGPARFHTNSRKPGRVCLVEKITP